MPRYIVLQLAIFSLLLMTIASLSASSSIWEGEIIEIKGKKILVDVHYTPYSSAGLYPLYCDTADKEGKLLTIDFTVKKDGSSIVHVPCIDDVPVMLDEFFAAAKPGMRILAFMNRKNWHYVSLIDRNTAVEVGYVEELAGEVLTLRRPQANWPNQMSNRIAHSAEQFPDRIFEVPYDTKAIGKDVKGQKVSAESLVAKGKPVMILPAAAMRVEWIPDPASRWDSQRDPLKGNFPDYPKRNHPTIDEDFYHFATSSVLLDVTLTEQEVVYRTSNPAKMVEGWRTFVPYGTHQGEYFVGSRGHKSVPVVAGHFNNFPTFPAMKVGRRFASWTYRNNRGTNWMLFDAQEMEAEGVITSINGQQVTLLVPTIDGDKEVTLKLDKDADFFRLGKTISQSDALKEGQNIRVYAARPFTVMAGIK